MRNMKVQERRAEKRRQRKFLIAGIGDVVKRTFDFDGNYSETYYLILDIDESEHVANLYKVYDIQRHTTDWDIFENKDGIITYKIVYSARRKDDEVDTFFYSP